MDFKRSCQSGGDADDVAGIGERLVFSVFDIFIQDLVTAYLIMPDSWIEIFKVFIFINVEAFLVGVVAPETNDVIACSLESYSGVLEFCTSEEVQVLEPFAQPRHFFKNFRIICEGNTREVCFKKFGIHISV